MIKDKLKIVLITYNRKDYLKRTLEQITDINSPIRDFDITILDNASTDGTSELIDEYCLQFKNIEHIRHKINIGGNGNIERAYEYGVSCGREYIWVICDDDKFDFTHWYQVEEEINNKTDVICVSNYAIPTNKQNDFKYQLLQLTFVPAGIYRSDIFNDSLTINMNDAITNMFPHICIGITAYKCSKKIKVIPDTIVLNGNTLENSKKDNSYIRGNNTKNILKRAKYNTWINGYCNVLTLLDNKKLQIQCIDTAVKSPYVLKDWYSLYRLQLGSLFFNPDSFTYFLEIYNYMNLYRKIQFILYCIFVHFLIAPHKTDKGIYLQIFRKIKTKIIPLKQ